MGNKGSAFKKPVPNTAIMVPQKHQNPLVPLEIKFSKINMVEYSKIFNSFEYKPENNVIVEQFIKSEIKNLSDRLSGNSILTTHLGHNFFLPPKSDDTQHNAEAEWFLDQQCRKNIINICKSVQFPLYEVLSFVIQYNQNEFLEFISTQELIEFEFWSRDYFKCVIFDIGVHNQ